MIELVGFLQGTMFFQVKSICSFSRQPKSFSMEECLEIKVLPKVAFFAWTATRDKIFTMGNRCNKQIHVVEWCSFCKDSGDFVHFLLLHYEFSFQLWSLVVCFFQPTPDHANCQGGWQICWFVGRDLQIGIRMRLFGMLLLCASCGLLGKNVTVTYSRGLNILYQI